LRATPPALLPGTPASTFAVVRGRALSATDAPLPNAAIRLRDARLGRVMASVKTNDEGAFEFLSVDPGSYIIELIGADQSIQATSALLHVNAGDTAETIVRLPMRPESLGGVLGATAGQAAVIAAAAASAGVLAVQSTTDVSPR
jgi:hypothetical protein